MKRLKKDMVNHKNSFLLFFLCVWLIISSIYYLPELVSGKLLDYRESSLVMVLLKYIVCLAFSVYALRGKYITIIMLMVILFFLGIWQTGIFSTHLPPGAVYTLTSVTILCCFFGISALYSNFTTKQINYLISILIFSGFLVSLFSVWQFLFLKELYQNYWNSIGHIRLTSTLLNPNNMAAYVTATLLLIIWSDYKIRYKVIIIPFMLFAIFMSGSRTALLSFLIVIIAKFFLDKKSKENLVLFIVSIVAVIVFIISFVNYNPSFLDTRILGLNSSGRVAMQLEYLSGFDVSYFFPDFSSSRYHLVQESSLLMLINSIGIMGFLFFLIFAFFNYQLNIRKMNFNYIFFYYIVLVFAGNFLGSYPNNLLLFFSAGSFFSLRNYNKIKF